MSLTIKPREFWYARMPSYIPTLPTPVSNIFCNYTRKEYLKGKPSPGARPSTQQIIEELLYLQRGDIHKYPDLRFNFMIAADGSVYEVRGWLSVPTLPLKWNNFSFKSLYIGYIGDFSEESPPDEMFNARDELIRYGIENNFITKKFLLLALNQPLNYKLPFTSYISR